MYLSKVDFSEDEVNDSTFVSVDNPNVVEAKMEKLVDCVAEVADNKGPGLALVGDENRRREGRALELALVGRY